MVLQAVSPYADADAKLQAWASRLERLARNPEALQFVPATLDWILDMRGDPAIALELLFRALERGDGKERALVAKLLCYFRQPEAVAALLRSARSDGDDRVAAEAARSLSLMEGLDTGASLLDLVNNSRRGHVVVNALYGLCRLGTDDGLRLAVGYLTDPGQSSKLRALLALNVSQRREQHLMIVVDLIAQLYISVPPIMREVVQYYADMGTAEARQRLHAISEDRRADDDIRAIALSRRAPPN
jgi:HEAT repeat protein